MSDNNNGFLSNYGKKTDDGVPDEIVVRDAGLDYNYEEKSGFKKPANSGGYTPPLKKLPKFLIPVIAGSVIVLGIVLALVFLLNGGVEVTDLTGWTLSDAQLWANENEVKLKTDEQYNDSFEDGEVISQDIPPGETMKKGGFLTLTVSLGHDLSVMLPLPDLMSMTMEEVEAWADSNYMTKVRITTEYSDTVPSGNVIRFEINDNTVVDEVRRDTPIYVIVSKGPEDESSMRSPWFPISRQ